MNKQKITMEIKRERAELLQVKNGGFVLHGIKGFIDPNKTKGSKFEDLIWCKTHKGVEPFESREKAAEFAKKYPALWIIHTVYWPLSRFSFRSRRIIISKFKLLWKYLRLELSHLASNLK
jgi:hypothetical protein